MSADKPNGLSACADFVMLTRFAAGAEEAASRAHTALAALEEELCRCRAAPAAGPPGPDLRELFVAYGAAEACVERLVREFAGVRQHLMGLPVRVGVQPEQPGRE